MQGYDKVKALKETTNYIPHLIDFNRKFSTLKPERQDSISENGFPFYTDGLKMEVGTGAGVISLNIENPTNSQTTKVSSKLTSLPLGKRQNWYIAKNKALRR